MGARLAAENQCQALDKKTARTYELRLVALENFAKANGDDAVLFGPDKRPFLAATIQTYNRKFFQVFLGGDNPLPKNNYTMAESVSVVNCSRLMKLLSFQKY